MCEAARALETAAGNPTDEGTGRAPFGPYAIACCSICAANATSWCEDCERFGRTFIAETGDRLGGSPVCPGCDDAGLCGVCFKHLMP